MNETNSVKLSSPNYLMVCLCPCKHSHCYTSSIPLKNLKKALADYLRKYGGKGQLEIIVYYEDPKTGEIKPLL